MLPTTPPLLAQLSSEFTLTFSTKISENVDESFTMPTRPPTLLADTAALPESVLIVELVI